MTRSAATEDASLAAAPARTEVADRRLDSRDGAPRDVAGLQRIVGNRATTRLLARKGSRAIPGPQPAVVQRHLPGVLAKLAVDLTAVRSTLKAYDTKDPTNGNLMEYVNKHITDINALPGMVTIVDTKEKLIEQLAIDMAARAEPPTAVDASHTASATDEVMNKGGGGFTAKDGTVWMLESTKDSSALYHELIHVLSGEGGVTQLSVTKGMLNEGFTNYFAEQLAAKYSKTIYPAYPIATLWVRKFATEFTDNTAYNIYFKNNEALLYSTLAGRLKTNLEAGKLLLDVDPKSTATKIKKTDLSQFFAGAKIKDESVLAAAIKKKIQEAYFMEAAEPSLAWLDRVIF